jgi:hypothetical protein
VQARGIRSCELPHARLEEYRWTLVVSRSHANFLAYAIDSLDTNLELLRHLPEKPGNAELTNQPSFHTADLDHNAMMD